MTGAMIPPQDLAFNPTPYMLSDGGFYESDGSADIAGTLFSREMMMMTFITPRGRRPPESRRNCTAFCNDIRLRLEQI